MRMNTTYQVVAFVPCAFERLLLRRVRILPCAVERRRVGCSRVAPSAFHALLWGASSFHERALHIRAAVLPRGLVQIAIDTHVRLRVAPGALERAFHSRHVAHHRVLLFVQLQLACADLVHELEELAVLPLRVWVLAHRARHLAGRTHGALLSRGVLRDLLARLLEPLRVVGRLVLQHRRRFRLLPRELLVRLARRLPRVVHMQRLEIVDPGFLSVCALMHELWRRLVVVVHRAIETRVCSVL